MNEPTLLRSPKAAEYLGISAWKLRHLKSQGRGPTPHDDPGRGGVTMYATTELDRFKKETTANV